jgi:hypothetical protein
VKHTTHTRKRLAAATLVVLTAGVSVGPTTSAAPSAYGVGEGLGATGASIVAVPRAGYAGLLSWPATPYNVTARTPSVIDLPRYETALPRPSPAIVAAPVAPTAPTGFDWLAAGIGIAIGFGLAVLAGLALLAGRRRRDQGSPSGWPERSETLG